MVRCNTERRVRRRRRILLSDGKRSTMPGCERLRTVTGRSGKAMTTSARVASTPAIAEHPVRAALLVSALGVVFGDIGTSPIYAFRESLKAANAGTEATVLGVLSLVFWAVILGVALIYGVFVVRADK